jgi:thymidylate synthase ThyX
LRHFIKLRSAKYAHGDIQVIAKQMYNLIKEHGLGVFVEDIDIGECVGES